MEGKEILNILESIQPDGFVWTDCTDSEMIKFKAIAEISFKAGKQNFAKELMAIIKSAPNGFAIPALIEPVIKKAAESK